MALRFMRPVLALAFCAACSETVVPSLASTVYRVVAVDGEALPAGVPVQQRAGCDVGVLHRSEFAFGVDSTFEQRFWFSADPNEQPAVFRTSFVQKGTRILVSEGAGSGSLRGESLRLQLPPTQICASLTWEAVPE